MANNCEARMSVVIPTRYTDKFLNYFRNYGNLVEEENKKTFHRSYIDSVETMEVNKNGMSLLLINFTSAWSTYDCFLVERDDDRNTITLQKALKECHVSRMTLASSEPGVGFDESMTFDKRRGTEIHYESRDCYPDPEGEYLTDEDVYMDEQVEKTVKKKTKDEVKKDKDEMEIG